MITSIVVCFFIFIAFFFSFLRKIYKVNRMTTLNFNTTNKDLWLSRIMEYRNCIQDDGCGTVVFTFPNIEVKNLKPVHIVSLACLIEHISRFNVEIKVDRKTSVGDYLFKTLKFKEYWAGGQDYSSVSDENILNLWRLKEAQMDFYGAEVTKYLKAKFNSDKDLSAVKLSITEAFYNVCDHADANGNAFSFILFEPDKQILHIAVCDFGIGIGNSVRTVLPYVNDEEALRKAIEPRFTVRSKKHNSGMGLDSIRGSSTEDQSMLILSNEAFLMTKGESIRTQKMDFEFKGTLVYYKINLNHYEVPETLDILDFDYL